MKIRHLLFDLDETLYPPNTGLWPVLGGRMNTYIHAKLGIPEDEVEDLRESYFQTYGTSLRGLQTNFDIDANEYLEYVHDVCVSDFIQPDETLQHILAELSGNKVVFTNASRAHAQRVMDALGVGSFFSQIIDVIDMAPYCKPQPEAFRTAMNLVNDPNPAHYLLLDDSLRNVQTARENGMAAILVSPTGFTLDHIPQSYSIHGIMEVLPDYFKDGKW